MTEGQKKEDSWVREDNRGQVAAPSDLPRASVSVFFSFFFFF
jgi:hypothetical protein